MADSRETARRYLFGDVVVDCHNFSVARGRQQQVLTPRAFDVLRYLIEHRGRVVEKAELFEQVWKEQFVSDNALSRMVADIRQALCDNAASPHYIETVPKRGYRFIAEVSVGAEAGADGAEVSGVPPAPGEAAGDPPAPAADLVAASRAAAGRRPFVRLDRRRSVLAVLAVAVLGIGVLAAYRLNRRGAAINSVAVMPIVNVGGVPEAEYLADGLTENIINNLSRVPGLRVMSRNAVFRYKGKELDPKAAGRELGVRAVLLTHLELRGDDLAISLELVDAEDNHQLWGQQLNRKLTDVDRVPGEIERRSWRSCNCPSPRRRSSSWQRVPPTTPRSFNCI